jgi:hypothetical protein
VTARVGLHAVVLASGLVSRPSAQGFGTSSCLTPGWHRGVSDAVVMVMVLSRPVLHWWDGGYCGDSRECGGQGGEREWLLPRYRSSVSPRMSRLRPGALGDRA